MNENGGERRGGWGQEETSGDSKKNGKNAIDFDLKKKSKNRIKNKNKFTFFLCLCVIIERQLLAKQLRQTEQRLGGAHLPSLLISITGEHAAVIKIHTAHTRSAFEMSYCGQSTSRPWISLLLFSRLEATSLYQTLNCCILQKILIHKKERHSNATNNIKPNVKLNLPGKLSD